MSRRARIFLILFYGALAVVLVLAAVFAMLRRGGPSMSGGYLATQQSTFGIVESIDVEAKQFTLTDVEGTAVEDDNLVDGRATFSLAAGYNDATEDFVETVPIGSYIEVRHCPSPGVKEPGSLKGMYFEVLSD